MPLSMFTRFHTMYLRRVFPFQHMGRGVRIDRSCDIQKEAAPYIYLGDEVLIGKGAWLNTPFESNSPVTGPSLIQIGDRSEVGRRCIITASNSIRIENDVLFGTGVLIADHSHEFRGPSIPNMKQGVKQPGRVIIEEGCRFGYLSAVVAHQGQEIVIGHHSMIGANAVVTQSCPPCSVLDGNTGSNVNKTARMLTREEESNQFELEIIAHDEICTQ